VAVGRHVCVGALAASDPFLLHVPDICGSRAARGRTVPFDDRGILVGHCVAVLAIVAVSAGMRGVRILP
jgi:hypothetical protein